MATESFIDNPVAEQRWLSQCIKTFQLDNETVVDFSPCVCKIPKTILETKPQAYVPRKLGLGPYHCFRPEFFVNERHKLTVAKNSMDLTTIQQFIIDKLRLIEPLIRAQYDIFLEMDTSTLSWIFTIDSLYLLHLLKSYGPGQEVDSDRRILAQDIIMLENQIPIALLMEIQIALGQPNVELFEELFYNFCKAHSPLGLSSKPKFRSFNFCKENTPHLLAYMHNLIVNKRPIVSEQPQSFPMMAMACSEKIVADSYLRMMPQTLPQNTIEIAKTLVTLGPGTIFEKPVSLISALPWDHITGLVNKEDNGEIKPKAEEIEIPSVAELEEICNIKFKLTDGGISDIQFIVEGSDRERIFYLPEIEIHSDTEVILRNLVAYEAAIAGPNSAQLELAEYVDFMCGIVDTPKDVAILKKANIINESSSLSDEEIADLFNGINKTTGKFKKKKKKTDLEIAIEKVNENFDGTLRVKAQRFINKHIYKSCKFLSLLSTIVLVVLLSLQAFCQVYGCSNRWFHTPGPINYSSF